MTLPPTFRTQHHVQVSPAHAVDAPLAVHAHHLQRGRDETRGGQVHMSVCLCGVPCGCPQRLAPILVVCESCEESVM